MLTLSKPLYHLKSVASPQVINQIQSWQDELEIWTTESTYFLQLLNWKRTVTSSTSNVASNQFEKFIQEEISPFSKEVGDLERKWKVLKIRPPSAGDALQNQQHNFHQRFGRLKRKFRLMKAKVLLELIESNPVSTS